MNYGNLMYNKIKIDMFEMFRLSCEMYFKNVFLFENVCLYVWCFLHYIVFNEFIGFGVFFCIYEDILKIGFHTF